MTIEAPFSNSASRILCIIPARGGSKGIPRKNVQDLGGKPLIIHAVDSAAAARTAMVTIVSTDNEEIAEVARAAGCPVLMRPAEFAEDATPIEPALFHAIEATGDCWDHLVLLQPTTPFRIGLDIDGATELLLNSGADSVVSLVDVGEKHPSRMYTLDDGRMQRILSEPQSRRRQDLPPVYIRNGAIYACRIATLKSTRTLIGPDCRGYVMPASRSVNIDEPEDLEYARFLLSRAQIR